MQAACAAARIVLLALKRAAAAYKAVCAAQAIMRDRRKAEVNAQKREVKAKAKPTPTRKSKAERKAEAKCGANGKASAGQTASMSGIDESKKNSWR